MKKILVPHDGYEMSDRALKYAIDIAKAMKMEIVLLRVIPEMTTYTDRAMHVAFLDNVERKGIKEELKRIDRDSKMQALGKLTKQLHMCDEKGVKAERIVEIGDPIEKILSIADKEDPYMIVMGSRRFKGLGKIKVLGSVAIAISERAERPVLIVH